MFESWHTPIPQLITDNEQILHNDVYDLTLPLMPFVQKRIALLGDATHAMTPNLSRGACSAIEDADTLGQHLSTKSKNLQTALIAYDAERRPATTKLVKRSHTLNRLAQTENPLLSTTRDAIVALDGKLLTLKQS